MMFVGQVVGTVVATRKSEMLLGKKLMIVKQTNNFQGKETLLVAVDTVGAGVGETVLVVTGSAARFALTTENTPVDAAIVGIVDTIDIANDD